MEKETEKTQTDSKKTDSHKKSTVHIKAKKPTVIKVNRSYSKTDKSPNKVDAPHSKADRYFEAVGRRKTAIARVRFFPNKNKGKEEVIVNEKDFNDYFPIPKQRATILEPLKALSLKDYYVTVIARGGGITGQAEAIRLGISRALILLNPIWRSRLKQLGLLKRDPRMVERKHPGLRKARRPQQWRKR